MPFVPVSPVPGRSRARRTTGTVALAGMLAAGLGGLAGCGPHATSAPGAVATRTRPSVTPAPTVTVVRSGPVVAAGRSAVVHAQAGVSLTLTASRPTLSRTRLSSSYGYPPAHGYYVTFVLTIVNTGRQPVDIGPPSFYVRVRGQGAVTTTTGNAAYSGASSQLDNTQIDPGETLRGPLTFDVGRVDGALVYAPDGSPAITWLY